MSTNFITFHPSTLCAASRCRAGSNSSSWFTPLFGWPKTPDYIESAADPEPKGTRFVPRGFTDEKAKQLRMMTTGKDAFHDVMYHSAIASRLASDFSIKQKQDS
ncbi:unnamed protein product [Rhodiola kirilowii]